MMVQSALRLAAVEKSSGQAGNLREASTSLRLLGESSVMQDIRAQIVRLARSMAPVAVTGESGSGKELAARDIHAQSARADKPFVAVNCGAIPEALMEAEFFGYRKGAFTGATDDRDGFFQAANGGTLMLDEVADLPLAMQVKLLRAIQERRVRKVGATAEEPVDVRLISATHQNLAQCVETGKFRQDLYYRLNVIELNLPPLRERMDDIGLLANAILARISAPAPVAVLTPQALEALRQYTFPGNVRELENILERALAFSNGGTIEAADLVLKAGAMQTGAVPAGAMPAADAARTPAQPPGTSVQMPPAARPEDSPPAIVPPGPAQDLPKSLPDHLDNVERDIIRRALEKTQFNRTQAAELLGISFRQLRYRMQRLSINEPE
jgi:two-component system response regulator PilR (NtrC family)